VENKKKEWDNSYVNRDNFVFYPHEEVIRFVSKYIRKRRGLEEFSDVSWFESKPKILDLGCGIGRHIFFANEMGLDPYGIDLSDSAIKVAREWAEQKGIDRVIDRIIQGDIRKMPWNSGYFNFVFSNGVLDSMHYEIARDAVKEVARVLEKDGLFYCDVVSGDDSNHAREYSGEEVVNTLHEQGTVQSYFNYSKLSTMIDGLFTIVECVLIKRENILDGKYTSRYHLVLKKE
jgi:ubiquinone/menaquinone biosynthesis C-methylase UbiE